MGVEDLSTRATRVDVKTSQCAGVFMTSIQFRSTAWQVVTAWQWRAAAPVPG